MRRTLIVWAVIYGLLAPNAEASSFSGAQWHSKLKVATDMLRSVVVYRDGGNEQFVVAVEMASGIAAMATEAEVELRNFVRTESPIASARVQGCRWISESTQANCNVFEPTEVEFLLRFYSPDEVEFEGCKDVRLQFSRVPELIGGISVQLELIVSKLRTLASKTDPSVTPLESLDADLKKLDDLYAVLKETYPARWDEPDRMGWYGWKVNLGRLPGPEVEDLWGASDRFVETFVDFNGMRWDPSQGSTSASLLENDRGVVSWWNGIGFTRRISAREACLDRINIRIEGDLTRWWRATLPGSGFYPLPVSVLGAGGAEDRLLSNLGSLNGHGIMWPEKWRLVLEARQ